MQENRTAFDAELFLDLSQDTGGPLGARLARALRDAVQTGRLPAGQRLPPTRRLAETLGVSRGLVVDCYAQLRAEGYLTSRPGSVTRVAVGSAAPPAGPVEPERTRPAVDFTPTAPDVAGFPRRDWQWALAEACRTVPTADLDYGHPQGNVRTRETIAAYLRRVRGASAGGDRTVVCAGFAQGLTLTLTALANAGITRIAVEDPGPAYRQIITGRVGVRAVPVPVDDDGIDVGALATTGVRAVLVTPAHQAPTGVVLTPQRRHALLAWAADHDAVIVEDDYDAEFRYDREPIGTLQGLAPDRVVLIGTVSKSLAPALRLGWIVSPPHLVAPLAHAKRYDDRGCPEIDQLALANLIESGRFDRHLRRMRKIYAARRQALVDALRTHAPQARVSGLAAGLHALARLPDHCDETTIIARAKERDIGLHGLSRYRASGKTRPPSLVFGFGHLSEQTIHRAIATVADLLTGPAEENAPGTMA